MGRSISRAIFAAATLACAFAAPSCSVLRSNLQVVEPGQFYRSGQMGGVELEAAARWYGIKNVVNLRGVDPGDVLWYQRELAACERVGAVHHDLSWSMRKLPTPESLVQLIEWIKTGPRPMLVHCQAGVHRAAIASAVYRLLRGDSVAQAREEIGLFFNDAPIGGLLDLYDESKSFEQWVHEDYPALYESWTNTDEH